MENIVAVASVGYEYQQSQAQDQWLDTWFNWKKIIKRRQITNNYWFEVLFLSFQKKIKKP